MGFKINNILKKILPSFIISLLKPILISIKKEILNKLLFRLDLIKYNRNYKKQIQSLKHKDKIRVVFFLLNVDTWKYDSIYRKMKNSKRYEPIVMICPITNKGDDFLLHEFNKSILFCKKEKYDFKEGLNFNNKTLLDVKKDINPDIVFFSNPNKLTNREFLISNFKDTLSCYATYSYRISKYFAYEYDADLLNLVWLNFCETKYHKELSEKYARNKARNTVISGFPQFDLLTDVSKVNIWKPQHKKLKKIIWAPHWTIRDFQNSTHNWACFLDYYEVFLKIAIEFRAEIQLAMKPHPFLRSVLEREDLWGVEKTNEYFNKWNQINNCQIADGDYIDLFKDSDAMIHDSGGFMAEYLVLNKPIGYTLNDRNIQDDLNEIGQELINNHYIINNEEELQNFIINVITDNDELKIERNNFIKNNLLFKEGEVSENILNEIEIRLK